MSKHTNMLLKIVEIMVSKGFPETREGGGGCDMGVVLHYNGIVTYNEIEYSARYYTGRYERNQPCVELYTKDAIAFTFDASEKCPISIAMHRAFEETFHTTIEKEEE